MKTNLLLVVLVFFCLVSHVNAQWQKTGGPGAAAGNVTSIAALGDKIFAATTLGGVFLSADAGAHWTAANNGLGPQMVTALVVSGTKIFAGTSGGLYVSADTGVSWTHNNNGLPNAPLQSLAVSGSKMFAGDSGGSIYFSADAGDNWTTINANLTGAAKLSLATDATTTFAGTYGAGVYVTTNDGVSWSPKNNGLGNLYVFALVRNGNEIFAGTGGGIFKSVNNGTTWTPFGAASITILSLTINGSYIFAGTYGSGIFFSPTSTQNWIGVVDGLTSYSVPSLASIGPDIYAGTADSGVYKQPLSAIISGIGEENGEAAFYVFPNPASSNFTISFTHLNAENVKIGIINLLGETVYSMQDQKVNGTLLKEIQLQHAPRGIYFVQLSTDKQNIVKRIILE